MPRNASGTYTLPSGNPVVSGTLIDATWANNTMADLGNEVTDSLSRSGEGAMLAPLRITDGVQATPSLAFSNEPSSGLYRAGTNEWWSVAAGVQVQQHTSTGAVTRFAAGAVGTPSVSAFNDVNTGIWFPAADTLAVSTAGVEALRVNSSGVLSLVNNPTLSGGTANGVLYLNGSKVATSGSALVFDGSKLGINRTPSAGYALDVDTSNGSYQRITGSDQGNVRLRFDNGGTGGRVWELVGGLSGANNADFSILDVTGGTSPLVITSTSLYTASGINVGIGTSSPATRLHVQGSAGQLMRVTDGTTGASIYSGSGLFGFNNQTGEDGMFGSTASHYLYFATNGAEKMRLDSSGNLGLGVSPSAWSLGKAIEVGAAGNSIWSGAGYIDMTRNVAYTGGAYKYSANGTAARFEIDTSVFAWFTAPSGTAGNAISFTQALTLNSNGNLALQGGTTSASGVGVTFPASQSASTDANCLDDYEEGTFTPTFVGSTTNPTYTTSDLHGSYTKIGRVVYFSIGISVSGVTAQGTGGLQIGGLPFTVFSSIYSSPVLIGYNDVFDTDFKTAYALSGDTKLQVIPTGVTQSNAQWGTPASATTSPLSTGYISIQGFYIVS
jgi:hypothetical protein